MKTTMKKLGSKSVTILLVFLLMLLLAPQMKVQALDSGDFQYVLINGSEAKITKYNGPGGAVVVPDTLDGHPVTYIGDYAFRDINLNSITLPDTVTVIGNYSFFCCSNLINLTIPSNLTSIGDGAFSSCTSLTDLTIPDSVATIGNSAFHSCSGLENLTISDGVASIGEYAFYGCSGLTSLLIPDGATIGESAFAGCSGLTSLSLPNNMTSIGDYVFSNCTSLENITLPSNLTSLGTGAFSGCSGLTDIVLPDGMTSIGVVAFRYCSNLESITIPDSVAAMEWGAFSDCSSLTSITIPDGVTSLTNSIFYGCTSLASISIPSSVTSIAGGAFNNCTSLTSIVLPDSVISIKESAFYNCSSLTSITIPDGVTSLANSIFYGCTSLTSISIPDSVTSVEDSAFYNCNRLSSVSLPDSVTSIGASAFNNCSSLTSITIPDGVTSLTYSIFNNCTGLESIQIPDSVTSIGSSAFYNCDSLTSVALPDGVTSIGASAFNNCSSLTSITIPGSLTSIGPNAFLDCDQLTVDGLHTVAFDSQGGSVVADIKYILKNTTITEPTIPTKSNFEFDGWYMDNTYTTKWDFANDTVTEDITLYAKWNRIPSSHSSRVEPNPVTTVSGADAIKSSAMINGQTIGSGKATVVVSKNIVSSLIRGVSDAKDQGKSSIIEIKVNAPFDIESVSLEIPNGSFKEIAQQKDVQFIINTGMCTIKFDASTMKSFSDQADTEKITISVTRVNKKELSSEISLVIGDRPVYDLSVYAGNAMISDFGEGTAVVSIPYELRTGEDKSAVVVYYLDKSDKLQTMIGNYNASEKAVVFKTSHFSNFLIGYNKVAFSDVKSDSWYSAPVSLLSAREITKGLGVNTFSPNSTLTRGQFIAMMMRAYNIAPELNATENFTDAGSTYYTGYLAAAKRLGITSGIGSNKFAPDRAVTRQEMFTLLYRTLSELEQLPVTTGVNNISDYSDADRVDNYAKEATRVFVESGILQGAEGKLNPNADLTRAEMSQVLYKLLLM